jgi:hypothetical protein
MKMIPMAKECQEGKHLERIIGDAVILDLEHLSQQVPSKKTAIEHDVPNI